MQIANPVWTLQNFQWGKEPCFACGAILRGMSLVHSFPSLMELKIIHNLSLF
jgi:hypothetical protein